jgi:hypothetical protein
MTGQRQTYLRHYRRAACRADMRRGTQDLRIM